MNRVSLTVIFFSSLALGFALWLIFDRFFVRQQNQLLERLDKADAIEASVIMARGGPIGHQIIRVKLLLTGLLASNGLSNSQRRQLFELPDVIDLLAVTLASGESLYSGLVRVSAKANGQVANDLHRVVMAVQLGSTLPAELRNWSARANSRQVSELCTKLQLALQRGTPLAEMLAEQSKALRSEAQQLISKRAGQNETRMLVPLIFLILPITVIFAVYPSLQVLSITQ
ncbi:MAG: hypothetical protein RL196_423 [Actinomycetota bacterium]|jgi:tight adherence protein C